MTKSRSLNHLYLGSASSPVKFLKLLMSLHFDLIYNHHIRALIASPTELLNHSLETHKKNHNQHRHCSKNRAKKEDKSCRRVLQTNSLAEVVLRHTAGSKPIMPISYNPEINNFD